MTNRRLPPALEEKVRDPAHTWAAVPVPDLLDWLYGVVGEPDIVKRILNRANELFESGWDIETAVEDALRAELGMDE